MLIEIGQKAKETSYILGKMGTDLKNAGLLAAAQEILDEEDEILKANAADVAKAKERGMAPGLVDRLELNHKRIEGIVEGMRQVVGLEDPVGEVISMKRRPNGLLIGQKRVPFGVIGIIYEARPNVTADAFALCFKTGNAVILRGGSDALESNKAIVTAIVRLHKDRMTHVLHPIADFPFDAHIGDLSDTVIVYSGTVSIQWVSISVCFCHRYQCQKINLML